MHVSFLPSLFCIDPSTLRYTHTIYSTILLVENFSHRESNYLPRRTKKQQWKCSEFLWFSVFFVPILAHPSPPHFPVSSQKTQQLIVMLVHQTLQSSGIPGHGVLLPISLDFNSMWHGTANSHSPCPQEDTKPSWSLKQLLRGAFSTTFRPSLNLFLRRYFSLSFRPFFHPQNLL